MIEPVSAEGLRKTGIFAVKAGDFRGFPPWDRRTGSLETSPKPRNAGISGPFAWSCRRPAEPRNGWLGREGSNLRMAESKSAALPLGYAPTGRNEGRIEPLGRLRQRPVYRGSCAISTGRTAEFRPKSGPVPRPPSIDILPWMRPGRFSSLRAAQYRHLRVESTPISWEDGSS